ncbi:MAG: YwaF family protein [Lachnospiraceae bacterium]|nr:YwaF family protein [Lachnospiraceae bacterium]
MKGEGFELFGRAHLTVIVVIIIVTASAVKICTGSGRTRLLRATALLLPAVEILKIIFLIRQGSFGIGYLPLHLCSLSVFLYPLYVFLKPGKVKNFLGDFSCLVLLPAALGAILFPDWTMYPLLSVLSLSSFIWHTLQVILPVCILFTGEARPGFKSVWKCILFLLVLAVPVYLFDRHFSCNYWFLLSPVPGPLKLLYDSFGYSLYLPALAGTVSLIIFAMEILISRFDKAERLT